MDTLALRQHESSVALRLRLEKGADRINNAAETRRSVEGFEAIHGPVPLRDSPMVLLQMVTQIAIRLVRHPLPKDMPNGARVGVMAIRGDAIYGHPDYRPGGAEEGLGRGKVPRVAGAYVHEVAISIDRPITVLPPPLDVHVRLIDVPACPHAAMAPLAQGLAEERRQLAFPIPHRFMRKNDAPLEKHFHQV